MSAERLTARYNEEFRAPGSDLPTFAQHVKDFPTLAPWDGEYLARPLFVAEREIREFADDLRHLIDTLFSLPDRMFGGDWEKFRSVLGISDGHWAAIQQYGGDVLPPHYGRADLYHDGTSFKLLETNLGSESGGWALASEMSLAAMEVAGFADFARRNRLGYVHNIRAVAAALRRSDRAPVVAMLEWRGGLTDYGGLALNFQAALRSVGLDILLAEVSDVHEHGGAVYLGDTKIDVVYRTFVPDQIVEEPDGWELVAPLLRAHRAGGTLLWTPFSSNVFANKAGMALLSDPARRRALSTDECRLIDRVLPWTRLINADVLKSDTDLIDECLARREQLILKVNARGGGVGVVVGWETDDITWQRALENSATEECVVQQRVIPRPELVVDPVSGETEEWQAVYGLFYTPDGYAGSYAKVVPTGSGGIISIAANARAVSAPVFHQSELPVWGEVPAVGELPAAAAK